MLSVKKVFSVVVALFVMAISSVAMAATDISNGVVRVTGIGAPGQPPYLGFIAARADAQRQLVAAVNGVQVDSETTVELSMVQNDTIKTKVSGLVKGAKIVDQGTNEYGYFVVMEMSVFGSNSIASAVIPQVPQQNFLQPAEVAPSVSTTVIVNNNIGTVPAPAPAVNPNQATVGNLYGATGQYTGLIVDCTGLGLQTAMAPAVYTDGKKVVYGLEHFSHDQVINRGYVGYSTSATTGVQRAGSNPRVGRAQSREHFVNPVISKEDAAKILAENQMNGFLSAGNVVFVK